MELAEFDPQQMREIIIKKKIKRIQNKKNIYSKLPEASKVQSKVFISECLELNEKLL